MTLDPSLVREARSLIARASLIAEAPGADFVPSGKRAYESNQPSGNSDSTHDEFRRLVQRARTDRELERAVGEMRKELERLKTPAPKLTSKELERRVVVDFRSVDAAWVAHSLGESVEWVHRIRRENGQKPADGLPRRDRPLPSSASNEERIERIRELREDDPFMSWRQIALKLGLSHTLVLELRKGAGIAEPDRKAA